MRHAPDVAKSAERVANLTEDLLAKLVFQPQPSAEYWLSDLCFSHARGYCFCKAKPDPYAALIDNLTNRFKNVAHETIEQQVRKMLVDLIDTLAADAAIDWQAGFSPGESGLQLATSEQLIAAATSLLADLTRLVRDHTNFVPLLGITLTMPELDMGRVKLVRTADSMPLIDSKQGSADFRYVNPAILNHFAAVPTLVQVDVTGDTEFARQEALRLANHLAAILNLHLARWGADSRVHQKIRASGAPPAYSSVELARVDLPDPEGTHRAVYLPAASKSNSMPRDFTPTHRNMVMQQPAYAELWACVTADSSACDARYKRLHRALAWFAKAASFTEPDAQLVGLMTALEILLVSKEAGIQDQLAERCGFLLDYDYKTVHGRVKQVKNLYGIRSRVVHAGAVATHEDVAKAAALASRVILRFADLDIKTFDKFETWIDIQKYSVDMKEIEQNRGLFL